MEWASSKKDFSSNPNALWTQYVTDNGGVKIFRLEMIEHYPCRSLNNLLEHERSWIDCHYYGIS